MVEDDAPRSPDDVDARDMRAHRPIIMAVDDDPGVLAAVRGDLNREYGRYYRVMAASGGAEAIELLNNLKLRGAPLALVVSDQRMPDVSGFEVLKAARETFAEVRTVLLTAYADTEVAIGAINELHLDYYIVKPWDPPEERLYPVVDDLLGDWHATHRPAQEVTRVVGSKWSADSHRVRDFLQRNQIPMQWLDVDSSDEGKRLHAAATDAFLPMVITPDGRQLMNPDVASLAAALGHRTHSDATVFDLAIVGAGPAGLAAAVYGASEGLTTVCIEQSSPGGQAGQSSRIENYLGFPNGIGGADLARRAVTQAKRFRVEVLSPATVTSLDVNGPYPRLGLADGSAVTCGSLILACGVTYNSLDVPGSRELEDRGVFYGAALSERDSVIGEEIVVVGGANSAGQAAVFLSEHAAKVTILCRSASLVDKMSTYLTEQIEARPNIVVQCRATVSQVDGGDRLETVSVEHLDDGTTTTLKASAMFIFIGASPHTSWLPPQILRDDRGFVLTGPSLGDRRVFTPGGDRDPYLYESSVPGIFAVGDVRAQSVKRVASAVGEGSVAVQFVHRHLQG